MTIRTYLSFLGRSPDFARLWLAQVVSLLGDWFSTIVLSALVVRYSPGNEGLAVSGLLMARFIPPMLISPAAGALVDRFDRKRLLMWSNLLRAAVVLGFLATTDNPDLLWLIYFLSVLQFTLSAIFEPGQSALIPNVVRRDDLVIANTLVTITWSVMLALGAVVGGVVATLFGARTALLIDALTFVIAAALIAFIRNYKGNAEAQGTAPADTSIREGLRFVRRRPDVGAVLLVKFGNSIGNIDTLMTIYATQVFVLGADGQLSLGIMYSAFGVGAILGPLLLNRFNDGSVPVMRRLIGLGFAWIALGWLVLGAAGSLIVVCLALLARAMGGSVNWTYSSIIIQKSVPDSHLGRVFALDMALFYAATVASTIVHGGVVDILGTQQVHLVAIGTFFASLLPLTVWLWLTRWLARRSLRETKPLVVGD
ncbi:MAG: MFS transporter [Aggregatilineales bacterium]